MIRTIGFLGTGKIAAAIVESLCTADAFSNEIILSPRNAEKSAGLSDRFKQVSTALSNQELIDRSDLLFIALKPGVYEELLPTLNFRPEQEIISLIPFMVYSESKSLLSPAGKITRAIPLPAVKTHLCPIPVFNISEQAMDVLSLIGQPFMVKTEAELHVLWTLTCLISPYFDLMGELSEWTADKGLDPALASTYVSDMFQALANESGAAGIPDFPELARGAATPGGMNEWTAEYIRRAGAHRAYTDAADEILSRFKQG